MRQCGKRPFQAGKVCVPGLEKRGNDMWRVETDFFALGVFLITLIKEGPQRWHKGDRQGNAFFLVLLFSTANVIIDIGGCTSTR